MHTQRARARLRARRAPRHAMMRESRIGAVIMLSPAALASCADARVTVCRGRKTNRRGYGCTGRSVSAQSASSPARTGPVPLVP